MRNKRRKHVKYVLGEVASGSFLKQLVLVSIVFLVAFLVSVAIQKIALARPLTLDDWKETLVEMLDAQVVIDHVFEHDTLPSGGWALLIIFILGTVFFSGLLIATITNIIAGYGDRFNTGQLIFRRLKNHVVFLGYDDMMVGVLNRMWEKGVFKQSDVVIALQEDVALFRTQVVSKLPSDYRDNLILVQANLNDESDVRKKLKVHKARKVYILGDSGLESHDSMNINSFLKICKVAEAKGRVPHCYVNFKHQSSFALFQVFAGPSSDDPEEKATDVGLFDRNKQFFHPFNFEEVWARKVLTSLDGEYDGFEIDTRIREGRRRCITEIPGGYVHIVVFGMSEMGEAFTKEISFLGHYQNYIADANARTRITIVDDDVEKPMNQFISRYSELFKYCRYRYVNYGETITQSVHPVDSDNDFLDMEFEFVEAHGADPRLMKQLEEWSCDEQQYLTLVFCYDDTVRNNAAALYLPRSVYESDTPIYIHQRNRGSLNEFLAKSMYSNVVPFGMCDDVIDIDESVEIAWAKRLNHYYCSGFNPNYTDLTQIENHWNAAKVSDRWSSIYNVAAIPIKFRSIGHHFVYGQPVPSFTPQQLETLARVEHNRWCVEKLMMGYKAASHEERERVAEASRRGDNTVKKALKQRFVSPDIVPFDQLGCDEKGVPMGDYDRKLCAECCAIVNQEIAKKESHT